MMKHLHGLEESASHPSPSPRGSAPSLYKWLEELASESNTIQKQKQEDIMSTRVMASNIRAKLYVNLRWLFNEISGLMCSFEMGSFVDLDMVSLLPWIAAGSSRKSI